jgi:ribosomal-protein-alanine N-acetyltransferase
MIRRCHESDAIYPLLERVIEHPWSRETLRQELAHSGSRAWLAQQSGAEAGGECVGFLLLRMGVDVAEILLVGVRPSARRAGLASELVREALREAERSGCPELQLELRQSYRAARKLYESLGFVVVGSRPRYYADGEAAALMTRYPDADAER